MNATELVKATNIKIRFIAFKEDVDKIYLDKKIPYEIKYKEGKGFGEIDLVDVEDLNNHYDIGYCLQYNFGKISANKVAYWIDKTKIFKPYRFEIDFEKQILFIHLKVLK